MHSAGARVLREDDNEMSREAVLLQWERKIEVADRLDAGERPEPRHPATPARRFVRQAAVAEAATEAGVQDAAARTEPIALRAEPAPAESGAAEPAPVARTAPVAERRTITITGQPTPARRRRHVMMDAQLAQPDRIALWAFLLGLLLVAVAAGTAHA
jgi:thiol:disulfide interchange protein